MKKKHVSYKLTGKLAPMHIYASATATGLDPAVYPGLLDSNGNPLPARRSLMTMQQARSLDLIQEVDLISIHTANTVRLRNIENESDEEVLTGDTTEDLAKTIADSQADIRDYRSKSALRKSVIKSVIELTMTHEILELKTKSILVFVKNIKEATDVKAEIIKAYRRVRPGLIASENIVRCAHSGNENSKRLINVSFKNKDFIFLVVVGMAQEGFNYPELDCVIDLCPNHSNPRRRIQKIGRILRRSPGKSCSRYYYPNTILNYIRVKGIQKEFNEDTMDNIERQLRTANAELTEAQTKEALEVASNAMKYAADITCGEVGEENPTITPALVSAKVNTLSEDAAEVEGEINLPDAPSDRIAYAIRVGYIISEARATQLQAKSVKLFDILQTKEGVTDIDAELRYYIKLLTKLNEEVSV